jgi:hypothetical protein
MTSFDRGEDGHHLREMSQPTRRGYRGMSLDGAHHANEHTVYDETAFEDYVGTPWLTGVISFATIAGTFVAAWTAILLAGEAHRGVATWWPLALILVLDLAVNLALRVVRARRRRAPGLSPPRRRPG